MSESKGCAFVRRPMPTLHIRTTPPGPRARMLLRRYERYVAPSATQSYPLVVDHAAGCHVWDVDGNCYLDFTAGIAVSAVGHGHKQVVGAITAQVDRLIHFSFADFFYPSYIRLAERLAELAPGREPKQVYLCNSGAEAIEGAIKLVRHSTRRPYILAFYNAFHGRTLGALSLTASKPVQRRGFAPLLPGVFHAPYPDPHRSRGDDPAEECLDHIENVLFHTVLPPEETAAIFVEPIQGEGGLVVPPDHFLTGLRRLCDRHGILLGDVRGRGLMIGVELVRNRRTKEPAERERDHVVQQAFRRGLLLLPCGRNVIRISPPLSITCDEVDQGLAVLEEVLS